MAVKVGIPRALGYYYLYPFYKTFLEELGAEVVVSSPTTKATLDRMESCPTDEPCVAVKLYFAHTDRLTELDVDFIFSPVLVSLEKDNFCCPKFLGITDMVRSGLRLDDGRLLSPRLDHRDGRNAHKPFLDTAAKLGIRDAGKVSHALRAAERAQLECEETMASQGLTIPEAYAPKPKFQIPSSNAQILQAKIGVIGHPYILYDMLSHDLIARLREYGRVITAEMVSRRDADRAMERVFEGHKMWSFEARMLGSALHLLRNRLVDKIILVGSFECGPESIVESYIQDEAERQDIPFLLLTVDEQTGEAGLVTRIEAFMDTSPKSSPHSHPPTSPSSHWTPGPLDPWIPGPLTIGFPSMGFLDIAVRAMLESCGTECLKSPRMSRRSVELGQELAPEFVCFPLTATLGQMRELLEMGANTIFMVGGKGRCRLGWYAQVQENLLRRAGYEFEMIALDSPVPLGTHWGPFRDTLRRLTGGASWPRIAGALYFGYRKMAALDRAEAICRRIKAVERERGTVGKLFDRFVRRIEWASDVKAIKRETREFEDAVQAVEKEDTNPLKVRIVGEIWVVLEHFVNCEIEKMLASQEDIRVEVDRELSATHWFRQHVLSDPRLKARERRIRRAASTYLSEEVGGHGQESVGSTVLAKEEGCDGVIHIFPFTCMPEIVAQNILVRVSEELDIPVLTFIVSEQTGEAGIQTRVQAFLDVLEERRHHEQGYTG